MTIEDRIIGVEELILRALERIADALETSNRMQAATDILVKENAKQTERAVNIMASKRLSEMESRHS